MALTGLHTDWQEGSYQNDRTLFVKQKENDKLLKGTDLSGLRPHQDSIPNQNPNWSIAIGYGYDLLKNDVATIKSDLASINVTLSAADETLLNDYHAGNKTKDEVLNGLTLTLTDESAASSLLGLKLSKYESALDTALGGSSQLLQSKERIAVLSLIYTMVDPVANKISNKIPKTIAAIKADNRAEAWYEIRYGSNADGQHATRRYQESDLFALYDTAGTTTDAEAKEIMRMYTRHKGEIVRYQISYPPTAANSNSIANDILPAYNHLVTTFATGKTIDNIIVGADIGDYLDTNPRDNIQGTDQNDLIFGEGGVDTIE